MTQPLVEVDDLVVRFPTSAGGGFHAVDGVSFTVSSGERVGVVGESGSGKSVTAQAMMRLVPQPGEISGGQVRFEGGDIMAMATQELQRWRGAQAAMIFQDPMSSLNPLLRVGTQITESLRLHLGMGKAEAVTRAAQLLERVGIPEARARLREYPGAFSGGMRQRVCVAIATACSPKLLIADEPTTALDVTVQAQVLDLLDSMADELGTAVLLISHDLGVISNFCDRIIVMYAGRVVETGTTEQIIGAPVHPYTRALLDSIPRLAADLPDRLRSIAGSPPLGARPAGCSFAPRCPRAVDRCREVDPRLVAVPGEDHAGHTVACGVAAPAAFAHADAVNDAGRQEVTP